MFSLFRSLFRPIDAFSSPQLKTSCSPVTRINQHEKNLEFVLFLKTRPTILSKFEKYIFKDDHYKLRN